MPNPKVLKTGLLYFLLHPIMLAFYLWVGILYFTPNYFQKYKAEIINNEHLKDYSKTFYHDLNDDGVSEKVSTGYNNGNNDIRIQLYNLNNQVYNQWTPKGKWLIYYKPMFGDYNNNGFSEIFCLTINGDSIFMSIIEPMLDSGLIIRDRFVCKAGTYLNGITDIVDWGGKLMDINGDSLLEFVFFIHSGFSKFPRSTFAYYINKDSLVNSQLSASGINQHIQFMDINGDGIEEITGHVGSPENIHYPLPYTDSSSWLMVMDPSTMDFQFPPIRFDGGIGSYVNPEFYSINKKKYIATTFYRNSAKFGIDDIQLNLFNENGKLLCENIVSKRFAKKISFINPNLEDVENFFLIDNNANIYKADTSLRLTRVYGSQIDDLFVEVLKYSILDADGDGEDELLFLGGNKKAENILLIFRQNLEASSSVVLPYSKHVSDYHFCLVKDGTSVSPILMLQADNIVYYVKYVNSGYYFYKYPTYIAVYLILLLFFVLLQKAQNKLAQRKFEAEKFLMKQKMALSKRQLEPHFMLNTLNNIGHMFSKENKEDAQYYFGRFASLIHRGLKYADQVEMSLYEEFEFVRDYLILQKKRFDGDFSFSIESEESLNLDKIFIPHSLVYTFVENAVKHGLRPKLGRKTLIIKAYKSGTETIITICDNGIGRQKSKVIGTGGTGKGLEIIASIIDGYNNLNNRFVRYDILDLTTGSIEKTGTEVRVYIG